MKRWPSAACERSVAVEDVDLDGHAPEAQRPVDELLAARERVSRGAEALRRLKPDEARR